MRGLLMNRARRFAVAVAVIAGCIACSAAPSLTPRLGSVAPVDSPLASPTGPSTPPAPSASAGTPGEAELPRGGQRIFPRYRLVGYAGLTGATTLGRLGTGPLDQRVTELETRARAYRQRREILPVLEVIASIVQGSPGRDGLYRVRISDDQIASYLRAARTHKALLLLNIQPGRSEFLPEVKAYARWLRE